MDDSTVCRCDETLDQHDDFGACIVAGCPCQGFEPAVSDHGDMEWDAEFEELDDDEFQWAEGPW